MGRKFLVGPSQDVRSGIDTRKAYNAVAASECAPVGGLGPYNVSQIQGYMEYTIPNGTAPPVPLIGNNTNSTATGVDVPRPTVTTFRGSAQGRGERAWNLIGVGALVVGISLVFDL
ncbi:hypothetical protein MMC15_005316 [Xylographa vitiligo]|nr:hypothetical protein [Xylographa vitiligo]